jgi:hypothetical protein
VSAFLLFALATLAPAQVAKIDETLRLANVAFEYRDFDNVIALLDPLMQPVVLVPSETQQATVRRLLGVARFVTGDTDGARREFSQLLLLEPDHKLDPTKIPPPVIEEFEELRDEMRVVLDTLIHERKKKLGALRPSIEEMFLPFGVPQYKLKHWAAGYALGTAQAVGLVLNFTGYGLLRTYYDDERRLRDDASTMMYAGLITWATAYLASVIIGNVLLPAP